MRYLVSVAVDLVKFSGGGEFRVFEKRGKFLFFKGFLLQESFGETVEDSGVCFQDGFSASCGFVGKKFDFLIDKFGGFLGIRFAGGDSIIASFPFREDEVARLFAHTFFDNHLFAKLGDILEVRGSAGRDGFRAENEFFGDTATHSTSKNVFEFVNILIAAVFGREEPGDAAGVPTRNDSNFMDGIGIR